MLLVGDVGGTKTTLAVFHSASDGPNPTAEMSLPSGDYEALEDLVAVFLDRNGASVDRACFGVAGPVVDRRATITNLPWKISEADLERALGLSSVWLINDLVATAYGVLQLERDESTVLNEGVLDENGAVAVVAPGTGLGEAFLTRDGSGFRAHPTEGGHVDFAPQDDLQIGLLRFLQKRFDHVSVERICSGLGLPHIYAFLKESGIAAEPDWLAERLAGAEDPNPVLVAAAGDNARPCELCRETLDMFCRILGAVAGNFALDVLATGGVYLAGGIPPKILPWLEAESFFDAFCAKGRFTSLMERMPVRVVQNPKVAIVGAAWFARERALDGG